VRVDRRDVEALAEQTQHQFPADPAGGTGHDRNALLLAHRPLLEIRCAILPVSLRAKRSNLVPCVPIQIAASPCGLLAMTAY